MTIAEILTFIDTGFVALPEFQRGYVWNRAQVRGLFDSLYRRHPVGGLLVWTTESESAQHRGEGKLAAGVVKLLLDGQQRITSIYGVVRGRAPEFFDGDAQAFTGLHFHLENEVFEFYQPIKMKDDSLWIDVTKIMAGGDDGVADLIARLAQDPKVGPRFATYVQRITKLQGILNIDLYAENITGKDKTLDTVVEIFNRVNSGGTKLSKGDLALAKISAEWPAARDRMKAALNVWNDAGYRFGKDWLLRSMNTILTGKAKFSFLHGLSATEVESGLDRAVKHTNMALNLIALRLGLDHDPAFFGTYGVPVMVRYLDQEKESLDAKERDKLLFWFAQVGMWGRFSASTETAIDKCLASLEGPKEGLDALIDELRLWRGSLQVQPDHFNSWSIGARFYPVLYMLTRMGRAVDWGMGLPLQVGMLGKMARLERHHIFAKSQLYDYGYTRPEVNALANFSFQTKGTNLKLSNRLPVDYFPDVESDYPGALESQWIPMDPELWKIEHYMEFLKARRRLLAEEANRCFETLLPGSTQPHEEAADLQRMPAPIGEISSEAEEQELEDLNGWMQSQGLPRGRMSYVYADPETGEQKALFDLAWPQGVQSGLTDPVAVLLNESAPVLNIASRAGFRFFTSATDFRDYINHEILKTPTLTA